MKIRGVDKERKVIFVEDIKDGIEVLEYIEKGYKIIKVSKIKAI